MLVRYLWWASSFWRLRWATTGPCKTRLRIEPPARWTYSRTFRTWNSGTHLRLSLPASGWVSRPDNAAHLPSTWPNTPEPPLQTKRLTCNLYKTHFVCVFFQIKAHKNNMTRVRKFNLRNWQGIDRIGNQDVLSRLTRRTHIASHLIRALLFTRFLCVVDVRAGRILELQVGVVTAWVHAGGGRWTHPFALAVGEVVGRLAEGAVHRAAFRLRPEHREEHVVGQDRVAVLLQTHVLLRARTCNTRNHEVRHGVQRHSA